MNFKATLRKIKGVFELATSDVALPEELLLLSAQVILCDEERRLRSADKTFEQILALDLPKPDRAFWSMERGKFCWVDLGDGIRTRQFFQQAYDLAKDSTYSSHVSLREIAAHAAENMMLMSISYEECGGWVERLQRLAPHEAVLTDHWPAITDLMNKGHPWTQAMIMTAGGWFNPDRTRDPGKYGPAACIFHLMLANRNTLRLNRQDQYASAGTYSALLLKMWGFNGQFQEERLGTSYPQELSILFQPAIPLVNEAVQATPNDRRLMECLERLVQCSKATRADIIAQHRAETVDQLLKELREHEWRNVPEQQLDEVATLLEAIEPIADSRATRPLIRLMGHLYNCGNTSEVRKVILRIMKRIGGEEIGRLVFQVLESDDITAEAATQCLARFPGHGAEEAFAAAMQLWDPFGRAPQRASNALVVMGYGELAAQLRAYLPRFPHNVSTDVRPVDFGSGGPPAETGKLASKADAKTGKQLTELIWNAAKERLRAEFRGISRRVRQIGAEIEEPNLILSFQWVDDLTETEAEALEMRLRAYLTCAIPAASEEQAATGSPFEGWYIFGRAQPTLVVKSQCNHASNTLRFTIGTPVVGPRDTPMADFGLITLHENFEADFRDFSI